MMIKKKLVYNLLFILGLFLWSIPSLANELNFDQCRLTVEAKTIDYGRIARSSITYDLSNHIKLPTKTGIVRLACPDEVDVNMTIRGMNATTSRFKFGQKSQLNIKLDRLSVDGKTVSASILRNNVRQKLMLLEPNDIIQSQTPIKGKNIELVLLVTPDIHPSESIQPDDIQQSDDIYIDLNKNVSDSFSVISSFSSVSCNPMVSNGGVIDYNRMHVSQLNPSGPTVLPAKILTLTIQCDATSNIAIRANSNRPNSLIDTRDGTQNNSGAARTNSAVRNAGLGKNLPNGISNITDPDVAGLGLSGGKKIGGYMMVMPVSEMMLDGKQATTRYFTSEKQPSSSSRWKHAFKDDVTGGSIFSGAYYFGYSTNEGNPTPQAFKNLTATLVIQAYISDRSNLNLSAPIQLDGSSKIEIYYY